ncbi:MAG TPA: single-stranded DNA-binding protein [Anaerolineae bacterium]|nr:single-stranded DNA-binding protein [Anaerolineae bacterium]
MFHRISLIGFVGQDPQMRYTPDGTPVTNFSVATRQVVSKERVGTCPKGWKESRNGKNWELTTWFRVTAWRRLAEAVNEYVAKGNQVFVEGELRGEASDGTQNPRIWQGNDGQSRASFELTARTVKFLGRRDNGGPPIGEPPPAGGEDADVLPF